MGKFRLFREAVVDVGHAAADQHEPLDAIATHIECDVVQGRKGRQHGGHGKNRGKNDHDPSSHCLAPLLAVLRPLSDGRDDRATTGLSVFLYRPSTFSLLPVIRWGLHSWTHIVRYMMLPSVFRLVQLSSYQRYPMGRSRALCKDGRPLLSLLLTSLGPKRPLVCRLHLATTMPRPQLQYPT